MSILNVMWAGGAAYLSTHKVHREILAFADAQDAVSSWLLLPGDSAPLQTIGTVESLGLSSSRLKGRGWQVLRRLYDRARLKRRLLREAPRLVMLDGIGVARYFLPLLRSLPATQVVVVFHGVKRLRAAEVRLLRDFPAQRLRLLAVSKTLSEDVARQVQLPVLGVRNALDPDSFRAALLSRDDARKALGLAASSSLLLGAVGRLVPEKGFVCLLQAVAPLLQANAALQLLILGEGPQRKELEALVAAYGLQQQVLLPGHVAQAVSCYRAFDLLCIPSEQEGLGLVLQEAVIAGVAVLASDLPVFREQLAIDAGFVTGNSAQAWQAAISQVLVAGSMSQLARQQVEALAPESAWASFQTVCRQLLQRA
jgi:glycosyltransferase involved in cell wall biosynthesis